MIDHNSKTESLTPETRPNLGSISEFERTLHIDAKIIVGFGAFHKVFLPRFWLSDLLVLVSRLLAPSNIRLSVRGYEIQYLTHALKGKEKLNTNHYAKYFLRNHNYHDLFIVFDDLSMENVFLKYDNGSMCDENSILIVDVGDERANSQKQVALRIAYGIGGLMGFEHVEACKRFQKSMIAVIL
ncbi:hypothetical protein MXB_3273 [Myxobolus squamalis]|nr:hypothetical protein MXB_3273 [Myxobolus squamalis]